MFIIPIFVIIFPGVLEAIFLLKKCYFNLSKRFFPAVACSIFENSLIWWISPLCFLHSWPTFCAFFGNACAHFLCVKSFVVREMYSSQVPVRFSHLNKCIPFVRVQKRFWRLSLDLCFLQFLERAQHNLHFLNNINCFYLKIFQTPHIISVKLGYQHPWVYSTAVYILACVFYCTILQILLLYINYHTNRIINAS